MRAEEHARAAGERDRRNEWFVPARGPERARLLVGLLFLPYTGMVIAYATIGSMLAPVVHWDRVVAIALVYLLALGIGAHALDALGGRGAKPWGAVLPRRGLVAVAVLAVAAAYAIGIWYMVRVAPWLWPIAILEGFFLLAYNLEWFGGRFHTDRWFAFSWGALPVLAGYVIQTNRVTAGAMLVATAAALLSLVEITASRPYKAIKRAAAPAPLSPATAARVLEGVLRYLSFGVIVLGAGLLAWRWGG